MPNVPLLVDTVTFTDSFDIEGFVRAVLADEPVVGSLPTDSSPLSWWERAWPIIAGSAYEKRVISAVVKSLSDKDPTVRGYAIALLEQHSEVIDTDTIVSLLTNHLDLFKGVKNPLRSGVDLKWSLLRVLGAKMSNSDDDGRAAIRGGENIVLNDPKDSPPLAAGLVQSDPEWTEQHLEKITDGQVATAIAILSNFQELGRDLVSVGRRLAAQLGKSSRFREQVREVVEDPEVQKAILSRPQRD